MKVFKCACGGNCKKEVLVGSGVINGHRISNSDSFIHHECYIMNEQFMMCRCGAVYNQNEVEECDCGAEMVSAVVDNLPTIDEMAGEFLQAMLA